MSGGSKAGPSSQTVKNGTQTENLVRNQQTTLPDWYLNQWQSILDQGNNLSNGGLALPIAGLMPDQLLASRLAGQTAQDYYNRTQIPAYDVFGMGNQWDKGVPQAAMANASMGVPDAEKAKVVNSVAAQLKPTDPIPFMNPFIDSALDPVLGKMGRANAEAQAGIGAQAAAAGAFGGSREAVSKMLSDRNYRDSVAQTSGQMLGQGWQQAVAQATGNVNNQQQSNMLNAQLGTNVELANAAAQNQLIGQNQGLNAQAGIANAQGQNALTGQYQNLSFQGAQADAGRFLDAVRLQQALDAQGAQTGMGIAQGLAGLGGQQQATTQNALDWYWKELGNLSNLLKIGNPGNTVNTTGTQTTNENSTANTTSEKPIDYASIGLGGLGLAGKFFGF